MPGGFRTRATPALQRVLQQFREGHPALLRKIPKDLARRWLSTAQTRKLLDQMPRSRSDWLKFNNSDSPAARQIEQGTFRERPRFCCVLCSPAVLVSFTVLSVSEVRVLICLFRLSPLGSSRFRFATSEEQMWEVPTGLGATVLPSVTCVTHPTLRDRRHIPTPRAEEWSSPRGKQENDHAQRN